MTNKKQMNIWDKNPSEGAKVLDLNLVKINATLHICNKFHNNLSECVLGIWESQIKNIARTRDLATFGNSILSYGEIR